MSKTFSVILSLLFIGVVVVIFSPILVPAPNGVHGQATQPLENVLDNEARKLAGEGRLEEAAKRLERRLKLKSNPEARRTLVSLYERTGETAKARTHIQHLLDDPLTTDSMTSPLIVEVFEVAKNAGLEKATGPMVERALVRLKPNRLQLDLDGLGSPDEGVLVSFSKAGESDNPFPVIEWTNAAESKLAALDLAAALYIAHWMNFNLALQYSRKALAVEPSDTGRIYAAYFASQIPGRRKEVEGYLGALTQRSTDARRCIGIIRDMTRD